ncbi:hypothetical protein CY34DRAFT_200407 [Suillus luteus UH-Slu-Lm8-n1]|uniref:Uncharacterized protein n=1 Tax=Suillus luteus UH-Slu-Lm8-n1 TaxID=930992 RepID=A0A0D0AI98_9AGAM|nr:hypothetical protein CY34DRAFT_200407 [Suillus luteus UH-Slu-Lm8-n1]
MKAAMEWTIHKIHKREFLVTTHAVSDSILVLTSRTGCTIRRLILVSEHIRSFFIFVSVESSASCLVVGPILTTSMHTLQQPRKRHQSRG